MEGTKDEFIAALNEISRAAERATAKCPPEFGRHTREGRALHALLTRLPEQIEDIKTLMIEGYRPSNSIITID